MEIKCIIIMVTFLTLNAQVIAQNDNIFLCLAQNGILKTSKPDEIFKTDNKLQVLAKARFTNTILQNGWATLDVESSSVHNNSLQAYGMGYIEGYTTRTLISQQWNNTVAGYCSKQSKYCKKLNTFLVNNLNWMLENIEKFPNDKYWQQVHLILLQVQGLEDGFYGKEKVDLSLRLTPFGMLFFQINGDLEDLESVLSDKRHLMKHPIGSGSCSGLIKVLDKNSDIFVSHDTWNVYQGMLRIIKKYKYNFHGFKTHEAAFSSSPGSIFSGDDFYILSSKIVAIETTNGNGNPDLWKYVTYDKVLEWIRNLVANRMANSGEEWSEIFSRLNSGTYNNQWMIVDYKKFVPGSANLNDGLLYILEQLPGMTVYQDETEVLRTKGYWASYNIPYFPKTFNASGQPAMVKKFGDWFTHDGNPRARIFARDQQTVVGMKSLIKLMRYNDFKNDPFSKCNCTPPYSAENTIAARSDLNKADGKYPFGALQQRAHGATDVKATSYNLMQFFSFVAECGPTHDTQPVFKWSTSPYANITHEGHPDVFDFEPVLITWN